MRWRSPAPRAENCRKTSQRWANWSRATRRAPGTASGRPKARPSRLSIGSTRPMNESLADPKLKARLADLGATVLTGSSADLGKLIADETEKWAKVIEFSKIKAE